VVKILLTRLFGIIPFLFRASSKLNAQKYQAVCPVELSALSLMIIFKAKIGSAWLIFITPRKNSAYLKQFSFLNASWPRNFCHLNS